MLVECADQKRLLYLQFFEFAVMNAMFVPLCGGGLN